MKKALIAAIGTTALLAATSAFAQTATAGDAKTAGEDLGQIAKLHSENTVKSAMKYKGKSITGFGIVESVNFMGPARRRVENQIFIRFKSALEIAPEDVTSTDLGVGCAILESSPSFASAADVETGQTISVKGDINDTAWMRGGLSISLDNCEIL